MSSSTPLLETIEADDPAPLQSESRTGNSNREPVVLTPGGGTRALDRLASTPGDTEAGVSFVHPHHIQHPIE